MDPLVRGALLLRGAFRRGHGLGASRGALGAFVVTGGAMARLRGVWDRRPRSSFGGFSSPRDFAPSCA